MMSGVRFGYRSNCQSSLTISAVPDQRNRLFRIPSIHEAHHLPFISHIKRIETKNSAEGTDIGTYRKRRFLERDHFPGAYRKLV